LTWIPAAFVDVNVAELALEAWRTLALETEYVQKQVEIYFMP